MKALLFISAVLLLAGCSLTSDRIPASWEASSCDSGDQQISDQLSRIESDVKELRAQQWRDEQ